MTKSKRIQLDPSKLLGVRQINQVIVGGKITLAKAMVGNGKLCTAPLAD